MISSYLESTFIDDIKPFILIFRMDGVKTIWECNSPDSLLDISARYCVTHLDTLITPSTDEEDTPYLPMEIGEKLFQMAQEEGVDMDDKFADIFRHLTRVECYIVTDWSRWYLPLLFRSVALV